MGQQSARIHFAQRQGHEDERSDVYSDSESMMMTARAIVILAAQDHFDCSTLEQFMAVFGIHHWPCADIWSNINAGLSDEDSVQPVHLLAAILYLRGDTRFCEEYPIGILHNVLNHITRLDTGTGT